jgi:RNA recognition motif-containing protein
MKDEIVNQTELTGFKLRLLKKQDESGNTKTFGFIEFSNRDDCLTFLESNISVNGETIRKRYAESKQ